MIFIVNITLYYKNILLILLYYNTNLNCEDNMLDNFLDYNLLSTKLNEIYGEEKVQQIMGQIRDNIAETSNVLKKSRTNLEQSKENSIKKGKQIITLQKELKDKEKELNTAKKKKKRR